MMEIFIPEPCQIYFLYLPVDFKSFLSQCALKEYIYYCVKLRLQRVNPTKQLQAYTHFLSPRFNSPVKEKKNTVKCVFMRLPFSLNDKVTLQQH